jgi:hypothetical protein
VDIISRYRLLLERCFNALDHLDLIFRHGAKNDALPRSPLSTFYLGTSFLCLTLTLGDCFLACPQFALDINLWSKVVCLFCLYRWDPLNQDASDWVLALFGKLLRRRGALTWFHGIWTCGAKVLEYWMIFSLKIKLNDSWKFRRNWNVPLVLLERSWWAGFNGIYLVRFGFRMWEILIFKWFLQLNMQINSKKPGFGRKNQLRTW